MSKPKRKGVALPSCMAVGSRESRTSGRAGARARRDSIFTPQTYLRRDKRHSGSGVEVFDLGDLSQAELVEHLNAMYPEASTPEREVDSEVRRKAEAAPMADRWTEKADPAAKLQALIAETVQQRTSYKRSTKVLDGKLTQIGPEYYMNLIAQAKVKLNEAVGEKQKQRARAELESLEAELEGITIRPKRPKSLEEFLRRYPHKADAVVRLLRKIS